ncbi:MAG TPA: hypothetical protein VH374_07930 [Polyangia bacterium]|jgi:hypothetical protein|nr:hypothetical protein [Polyangia bacterium]
MPAPESIVANPSSLAWRKIIRLSLPLILFVVPTVAIGFGVLIPNSCIAGWNQLSLGFGSTVFFACVTYVMGVRAALKG